jgi:hypothetical protein
MAMAEEKKEGNGVSRRDFLKGAAVAVGATALGVAEGANNPAQAKSAEAIRTEVQANIAAAHAPTNPEIKAKVDAVTANSPASHLDAASLNAKIQNEARNPSRLENPHGGDLPSGQVGSGTTSLENPHGGDLPSGLVGTSTLESPHGDPQPGLVGSTGETVQGGSTTAAVTSENPTVRQNIFRRAGTALANTIRGGSDSDSN